MLYGDADLNFTVNSADFTALALHFGQSSSVWTEGDFNYNGVVNAIDFNDIAINFGRTLPALGSVVPETGSVMLLALGLFPRRCRFFACRAHAAERKLSAAATLRKSWESKM